MSRLLYQAELHRRDDRAARSRDRTDGSCCTSPFTESNRRPSPYHGDALPTELKGQRRRTIHTPSMDEKSAPDGVPEGSPAASEAASQADSQADSRVAWIRGHPTASSSS